MMPQQTRKGTQEPENPIVARTMNQDRNWAINKDRKPQMKMRTKKLDEDEKQESLAVSPKKTTHQDKQYR